MAASAQLPVLIIGAGLAGLTLARTLLKSHIPAIVFEASKQGRSPGHGLTLRPRAYIALAEVLGCNEDTLRKTLAVDAKIGGNGTVRPELVVDARFGKLQRDEQKACQDGELMRLNKRRLRDQLAQGVDIRWEHKCNKVDQKSAGVVSAVFANGTTVDGSLLIAADGVHSTVREQVLSDVKANVLPFVVFNGQRKYSRADFSNVFLPILSQTTSLYASLGEVSLGLSINDAREEEVYLSYTYSRPARENDPLYKPDRSKEEAKTVPEEFFDEIKQLQKLAQPFKEIFDAEKMREDKLLSWLMRSVKVEDSEFAQLPDGVGLIGDAAHAPPIMAGVGGEQAIMDGIELAETIVKQRDGAYTTFLRESMARWREGLTESEGNLDQLHKHSGSKM